VYVLGLSGGLNRSGDDRFLLPAFLEHDAAAALYRDGRLVAAIEEERLSRFKHAPSFPREAIRFCLAAAGIRLADVGAIGWYGEEETWNRFLLHQERPPGGDIRAVIAGLLEEEHGCQVGDRLQFVAHHLCHALSAYAMSGFDRALVMTLDGRGDDESGSVWTAGPDGFEQIASIPVEDSLGELYLNVIEYIGFELFEEYKVMGLAPYGDPSRTLPALRGLYTLEPDGRWSLTCDKDAVFCALAPLGPRRWRGQERERLHQDIAAGLQGALEEILLHALGHYREATGLDQLCLAGGVAHNCAANGKILRSGLFSRLFVQPASHDAGCSLGAALALHNQGAGMPVERIEHVYWGRHIGSDEELAERLAGWAPLVTAERSADVCERAARMLADGEVLGWAQGRSEFGPRALGNRSILADPRPVGNRERINAMIKKREAFRPFAPAVLEEELTRYFDLPAGADPLPFMTVVVEVRPEHRELLGAVTHVDGSARVQTVSRRTSERTWRLIDRFRALTGVPVLLNTSFNNHREPIVDSVDDVIACLLTTQLDVCVVGDHIVRKRPIRRADLDALALRVPAHVRAVAITGARADGSRTTRWHAELTCGAEGCRLRRELSAAAYHLLSRAGAGAPVGELTRTGPWSELDDDAALAELLDLWSDRLIQLAPGARGG